MWGRESYHLHIVIRDELGGLVVSVLILVVAQSSLINDEVGDVLGMLN